MRTARDGTMDECLACLGDFSMRKRRDRADGDTRNEAIVSGVGRFLTHFVRPFSIAHLRRREAFGFPFHLSLGLPLACSPLSVSAWLVSSPARGSVAGRASWRGAIRLGRSAVRFCCSSLRPVPLVSLCGSFDFPRIDWRVEEVRRFCQLILLRHSLAAGQIVFPHSLRSSPFVSSLVSLVRLVWRLVSILCGSLLVPFLLINSSASRFSSRSAVRFSLSHCLSCSSFLDVLSLRFISPASRCSRLARSSR